jgi:PAS domain S-box-containing protein
LIIGTIFGVVLAAAAAWGVSKYLRTARALRDSEEGLRLLLDGLQDYAIFALDQKGLVVSWNAGAERVKGYTTQEIIGQNFSRFFPQRDVAQHKPEEILRMAATIGRFEESAKRVRKDGSEFLAAVTDSALHDVAGNLRGFSVICHDLTAIEESEAKYRGLLEAAPDGMVVVNSAGQIVLLNTRAEAQFGYARDELLGQDVKNIIPQGFADRLIADAIRTAAEALQQQISTGTELVGRRKDGTKFPIEIMLSPLESAEGVSVTAAIRDISERKQLENQLHQSQKMEAVGQLTGGITHDFNNLLTVIIGNLGLLELMVSDNEAAVKRVNITQKAAARGVDITRRLLVFSNKEELAPSFVSIGDSIQNVIEMASRSLGSGIKFATHLDELLPPLFVDPAGLESALLNLMVNARDAMPKGGSIIISSELKELTRSDPAVKTGDLKQGCYVCLSVMDTGQGMSRETLQRACEPFFTTKPRSKGTGLGLAMVYGFVKKSGGVVRISSEIGHGTTVSLYLPIVADLSHSISTGTPQISTAELAGTVLVVDGGADLPEVATVYLEEMGLTALKAKDGASALKAIAQSTPIDLMITDIVMPGGMNGAELAEEIQPAILRRLNKHPAPKAVTQNILVVDDDSAVGEFVCAIAMPMGFQCTVTTDAKALLEKLSADTTLILLDLMMPEMDGIELLRLFGQQKCKAGIVLMSGVNTRTIEAAEQFGQVLGLSIVGYLQKPLQKAELEEILQRFPSPNPPTAISGHPPFAVQKKDLEEAIQKNEFVVYYQPQIDIASGRVIGVEALVRWRHPRRGLIFPDSFIGRMEKFGLIDELGWIVANRGLSEVGRFANDDSHPIALSLNASVDSLCNLAFPDTLVSIAEKHGVLPANVTIEITETGLIRELARTLDTLTRLRMKEVKLSIDDFGTGYAMMRQFKTIPATELKIDKSFVQELTSNSRDRIMVQKTIEMGHELGIQVVAEGVETQEQLDLLRSYGCNSAQGYFFSRPIPAGEMANWLKTYRNGLAHS